MNIYVGNLSSEVSDEDLNALFVSHGSVTSAKVIRDNYSQQSRGFGFVEMPEKSEAESALNALNSSEFKGKQITVNEARPRRDRASGGRGRRY